MIGAGNRAAVGLFALALYGGPVLAGLAGHGAAVLPVFAALFLIYIAAARQPDLRTGAGWLSLGLFAVVQIGLVGLCWAAGLVLGQGLQGGIASVTVPLWGPIAMTALAAFLGAWASRDAAEMDAFLDSALARLSEMEDRAEAHAGADMAALWPVAHPAVEAAVRGALDQLTRLDSGDMAEIDAIVAALAAEQGAAAFDPFYDAAAREGAENAPAVDLGLLRFVACPQVLEALLTRGEAALAPALLFDAPDARVRAEARGLVARLQVRGLGAPELPDPDYLADLDGQFPGEG